MKIMLERIDTSNNMFRFYNIRLEENLFGDYSVIAQWGRIGVSTRSRVCASGNKKHAEGKFIKILGEKINRGYGIRLPYEGE